MRTTLITLVAKMKIAVLLLFVLIIVGCSSTQFELKDLAKSDIDDVLDIHMEQVFAQLKQLTIKLYKKNPYELSKHPGQTIESRIEQIFTCPINKNVEELSDKESIDAILLGFEPEFSGDRVFAMMYGLYSMIHQSYKYKCELFVLDLLDEQDLYNCARNIEIFIWRLKTRQRENGQLFILTNGFEGENKNLSFERAFGKLISLQDTMALIVSKRTGRLIKEAVQFAGMAFLPIGI